MHVSGFYFLQIYMMAIMKLFLYTYQLTVSSTLQIQKDQDLQLA